MANSLDYGNYGRTRLEWLANLNTEYKPPRIFRRTSIICTIGKSKSFFERHATITRSELIVCTCIVGCDNLTRVARLSKKHVPKA